MSTDGLGNGFRCSGRTRAGVGPFLMAALSACFLSLGWGCGSAPVRLTGRAAAPTTARLSGAYDATFSAPFFGTFTGRINAEATKDGFRATTRPGAAWALVGGVEEFLGPIIMPLLFPHGVILTWTSSVPYGGRPGEGWIGSGGMRKYGLRTRMDAAGEPVRLLLPDGRTVAMMTLKPARPRTITAYSAVADRISEAVRTRLFVPPDKGRVSPTAGLEGYLAQVRSAASLARDDLEFGFGVVMAARSNLRFFPIALRRTDPEAEQVLRTWPEKDLATMRWTFDDQTGIGALSVDLFLEAGDIDRNLGAVLARSPRALVIDLRGCPGIELSALRVLAWLSQEPADAGTFYGPKGAQGARQVRLVDSADFDRAGAVLDAAGAARLTVAPVPASAARPFTGPVVLLTSRRTGGTAEALAAILKARGRASIVGEPTSGRVVLSRPVDVGQGWLLRLPSAGWLAPDGGAVGARGVEPDVRAAGDAAMERAMSLLKQ